MLARKLALFLTAATTAGAFYINFCNLVFQCGCHSLWNGGVDFCNIHIAGVKHCPWCSYGYWGYLPFIAIVSTQAAVVFWRKPLPFASRTLFTFLAFPAIGGFFALIFGWGSGYWAD